MKFRLNLPHAVLAHNFNCIQATLTNLFLTWMHILYEVYFLKVMAEIPSRNKTKLCLPSTLAHSLIVES